MNLGTGPTRGSHSAKPKLLIRCIDAPHSRSGSPPGTSPISGMVGGGVLLVGMALVAQTLVTIFMVNPVLNGLIFGIILTGIVLNVRQVNMLAPEARWIETFHGSDPARRDSFGEMPSVSGEAELKLLSPMARMLEEKRNRGSGGKLTLSAPVMRTLLDGIGARLEESRDLARYLTGLCIFLGLLGTFWGLLGTVGEPINPEAWMWYHETVGQKRCPIVDTWWQTETGGHMITPLPGVTATKPGSCTFPLPGIIADIVDE